MVSEKIRGLIVSDKLTKTVTVLVQRQKMHPIYKKSFKVSKKYLAHDSIGAKMGDIVDMVKIRPVSKNKHWKILSIVGKDIEAVTGEKLKQEAAEAIAQVLPAVRQVMPVEEESSEKEIKEEKPKRRRKLK